MHRYIQGEGCGNAHAPGIKERRGTSGEEPAVYGNGGCAGRLPFWEGAHPKCRGIVAMMRRACNDL